MKSILLSVNLILLAFISNAQPGTLDKAFGTDGIVTTNFGENVSLTTNRACMQADDKIIVTGNYGTSVPADSNLNGFLAVRYNPDGSLDYTFGDSGKTIIHFPFESYSEARSAAIQSDGKILLEGYGWYNFFKPIYSGILTRLNADGSVDSSFGENGNIQTTINGGNGYVSVNIQNDNSIIAVGGAGNVGLISRFSENGIIDKTFGNEGYVLTGKNIVFTSSQLQPDGKLVVAGYYYKTDITQRKFCLQRYLANGSLDRSFGDTGTVITNYGDDGAIHDIALQPDGKIVATGETTDFSGNFLTYFATARYNQDGSLDNTFGLNGNATTKFGDSFAIAQSVAILKNGDILIGGEKDGDVSSDDALIALTGNGLRDSTFGYQGEALSGFDYSSFIKSVLLQKSGKIVSTGGVVTSTGYINIALARYNNDNSLKQQIFAKIRHWLQHRSGIAWESNNNVRSYVVQRSYDGVHFSSLAKISTNVSPSYTYQDPTPLTLSGTNYYRLQTTSLTGSVNYSNILAVANIDIKISPNPAKNKLHIEGLPSQKVNLSVVDYSGNPKLEVEVNNNSCDLNIAALKPGNYLLKIECSNDVVTKAFIKE